MQYAMQAMMWGMQARNEVRVLAGLKHPNIVRYFESFVDSPGGRLLIVMELCEVRSALRD